MMMKKEGSLLRTVIAVTLTLLLCFLTADSEIRCIESERRALLNFKQDLDVPSDWLASWTASDVNCCDWVGVVCHNHTGHVLQLHLASFMFGGEINPSLLDLKHLIYLDLSGNYFIHTPIPKFLGSMGSLRYLNLSQAGFVGLIPHQLGNLSNLQYLDLECDYYDLHVKNLQWLSGLPLLQHLDLSFANLSQASDWLQEINKLPSLSELRLSSCALSGFIPPPIPSSINFSSLTTLDLSSNSLDFNSILFWVFGLHNLVSLDLSENLVPGPIPVHLQNLTSLRHLDLSLTFFNSSIPNWLYSFGHLQFLNLGYNNLQGRISSAIGNLTSAISIDLSSNELEGNVPRSIGNLSSLRSLDLGHNQINGTLPQSFGQLSKLESVNIGFNMLEGVVSEVHFAKLMRLKKLFASHNRLTLKVSDNWTPPFQLNTLVLRSWNLGSKFPSWLYSQKQLLSLDISNTGIIDAVPPWFWNLSSQFDYLNISHNQIYGEFPHIPLILSYLSTIDLSSNNFTGPLPCISSNVTFLDLSNNLLSGSISHFLCYKINDFQSVEFLNLGNNLLSGKISNCWMKWQSLILLNLENNNFIGKIPASIGSLINLQSLHMYNNKLSGKLLSLLKNCTDLVTIDIGKNEFDGSIPKWIGHRLSSLKILSLRSNNFWGQIPDELYALASLQILDLSHNKLFGSIPKCVNNFITMARNNNSISPFYFFDVVSPDYSDGPFESELLVIKGNSLEYSTTLGLVNIIDLSNNNLSGEIPKEVASLQGLQSLNLSFNILTGRIPENIGDMRSIESIDFSINQLSGQIPQSMSSLTFLSHLNLSNNNLIGRIPSSTQLQSLSASSFFGNKLCGPPLTENCTINYVKPNIENKRNKGFGGHMVDWFFVSMALGFVVGFWVVLGPLLWNKQWRILYFQFLDHLGYKLSGVVAQTRHSIMLIAPHIADCFANPGQNASAEGGSNVQNHLQLFAQDIAEVKEFLKQKGGDIGC
ncbi:hypothetical protein ACB098_06G004900 [Castanea mollissima]